MTNDSRTSFIAYYVNEQVKSAYIPIVWVDTKLRGKGAAKQMFNILIAKLIEESYRTLSLEVRKDNQIAHTLYKKLGFKEVEDRAEKILMQLQL